MEIDQVRYLTKYVEVLLNALNALEKDKAMITAQGMILAEVADELSAEIKSNREIADGRLAEIESLKEEVAARERELANYKSKLAQVEAAHEEEKSALHRELQKLKQPAAPEKSALNF